MLLLSDFYQRKYCDEAGEGGEGEGTATGDITPGAEDTGEGEGTGEGKGGETKTPEEIKAAEEAKEFEGKTDEEIEAIKSKKAEDAAAAEKAEKDGEGEPGDGAPEKYEAFTLPKELEQNIDAAQMENFSAVAKDLDLNQEQAQKLVNFEVQRQTKMFEDYAAQTEKWSEDTKLDKEIGGADFELKQAKASKAYEMVATDELRTLMNPYHPVDNPTGQGLGNHPEMMRLFYRIGLKVSEDGLITDTSNGAQKLDREDVMYGKTDK